MKTSPPPIEVVATEGVELITADGRRLIDGMASWWSACHGYNHPHLVEAMQTQLRRMPHVMFGGITHEGAQRLASRLCEKLPGDLSHVFYSDSGSVAVEVAMKMAIGYWLRHGRPTRNRFVAFDQAYHGDTTGAMSLGDPDRSMHASFQGAILKQFHAALPVDAQSEQGLDDLLSRHKDSIAGVFVEPLVQCAGGMKFHDSETVGRIRAACDRHDVLMIADEVATGFGRTGTMFAMDQCDCVPDVICLGKALTGGMTTMAVTIARPHVFEAFWSDRREDALMHGPTFMANPLACAAANASLDLFESEPRLEQAAAIERQLAEHLSRMRSMPGVVDTRCRGAIGVVQFESISDSDALRQRMVDAGVWLRPIGNCIYTAPSLTVSASQIEQICDAIQSP